MKISQVMLSLSYLQSSNSDFRQIYLYPIKSLRGVSIPTAKICAQGIEYDRRYILLKCRDDGTYKYGFVGDMPEMALFHSALSSPTTFTVSYHTPPAPVAPFNHSQQTTIEIPFEPVVTNLEQTEITLHKKSDFPAYIMPDKYNKWFSECFGYKVVLAYLGDGLGSPTKEKNAQDWIPKLEAIIPNPSETLAFSDGGALLVTSEKSMEDLHPRLANDEKAIHEKFRPNIIVDGAAAPWDEDFWGELHLPASGIKIVLTTHCARCVSINVDLEKGTMGDGDSGKLLKKMMRDRRVDPGQKWTPIFGRYGFPLSAGEIQVDDEVVVSRRNTEHTTWSKSHQCRLFTKADKITDGYVPRLTKLESSASLPEVK